MSTSPPTVVRVVVVDDHDIVRVGVRQLLAGRAVLREAGNLSEAMATLAHEGAELLLLDLALGDEFGLTALPRLRATYPGMRILVLSSMPEDLYAERVLKAGADGFVSKTALVATLHEAVDTVLAGRVYVSPAMRDRLLRRVGETTPGKPELSPREMEVLRLVAAGKTTREIANTLNRSVKTVESHKQALKTKLGADSPAQLVRQAMHWIGEGR